MRRSVVILFLALTAGAVALDPNGSRAPASCLVKGTLPALRCGFYPKVAEPKLFKGPSGGEVHVEPGWEGGHPAASYLNDFVAEPDDLDAGVARVRIYHLRKPLQLWVDRKDIVRISDLKEVRRCWEIQRLFIGKAGKASAENTISFGREGVGFRGFDMGKWIPPGDVQAWYFEGVWSVRVTGRAAQFKGDGEVAWGNLDVANWKLIGRAPWSVESELVQGIPASCASGPVIEGTGGLKPVFGISEVEARIAIRPTQVTLQRSGSDSFVSFRLEKEGWKKSDGSGVVDGKELLCDEQDRVDLPVEQVVRAAIPEKARVKKVMHITGNRTLVVYSVEPPRDEGSGYAQLWLVNLVPGQNGALERLGSAEFADVGSGEGFGALHLLEGNTVLAVTCQAIASEWGLAASAFLIEK